jgi:hypothetical protein
MSNRITPVREAGGAGQGKADLGIIVKLELQPEVQAGLVAEADARGLSLEAYILQVIQDHAVTAPALSTEAWESEFDGWLSSFPDVPILSDEAISRDSMYPDKW